MRRGVIVSPGKWTFRREREEIITGKLLLGYSIKLFHFQAIVALAKSTVVWRNNHEERERNDWNIKRESAKEKE